MTFLNDDWKDWLDENKVKNILGRICFLNNKEYSTRSEYFPVWVRQVAITDYVDVHKRLNKPYEIIEEVGYASGYIALRRKDINQYKIHYPDYGGELKAVNVPIFKKIFKDYPIARLDKEVKFYMSIDNEVIANMHIDLSMGISQDGRAGCHLVCNIDSFLYEYEQLFELISKRGGRWGDWSEWRIRFEKYVANCEYVHMGMRWGKGYEIEKIDDDEIPF